MSAEIAKVAPVIVKPVIVMQDRGNGLRHVRAYQAFTQDGLRLGFPQATAKLARAWAQG